MHGWLKTIARQVFLVVDVKNDLFLAMYANLSLYMYFLPYTALFCPLGCTKNI